MASTLTYQAIRKTFAGQAAIESFDLAMEPGELVSLLGPSGCGKTTALRIAAGFEQPDSGAILVDDRNVVGTPPHRRNMGMVFQSYSLFPNLDVSGNVAFGLRVRRVAKADQQRRVGEALERVHLSHLANRYPHQLSGGQQQRVALARALVFEPAVLLLDEPLSALDAKVRVNLREEIRRLQLQLGMTTLFVTHDQEEALSISDRMGVMSNGRLEQLGTPREVYANPATSFVARFVGRINELPAEVTTDGITVAGVRIGVAAPSAAAVGSAVTVMSRPEDVRVHRPDAGANGAALPGHGRQRALRRFDEPAARALGPPRRARRRPAHPGGRRLDARLRRRRPRRDRADALQGARRRLRRPRPPTTSMSPSYGSPPRSGDDPSDAGRFLLDAGRSVPTVEMSFFESPNARGGGATSSGSRRPITAAGRGTATPATPARRPGCSCGRWSERCPTSASPGSPSTSPSRSRWPASTSTSR